MAKRVWFNCAPHVVLGRTVCNLQLSMTANSRNVVARLIHSFVAGPIATPYDLGTAKNSSNVTWLAGQLV